MRNLLDSGHGHSGWKVASICVTAPEECDFEQVTSLRNCDDVMTLIATRDFLEKESHPVVTD